MANYKHAVDSQRFSLSPGQLVGAASTSTEVVRGLQTDPVQREGSTVFTEWDGQLYQGEMTLGGLNGHPKGSVEIHRGELYVHGIYNPPFLQVVQSAFPVVVTKGPVKAGSVGTHWCVLSDPKTTYIVLLSPPGGGDAGAIEIDDPRDANTVWRARIRNANHFIDLPDHRLRHDGQVAKALVGELAERVEKLKLRAQDAGLRDRRG